MLKEEQRFVTSDILEGMTSISALLNADGTLNAKGWARHNVFDYNRDFVKPGSIMSKKEWDFYQVSNGKYMVQLSFANINIGGYVGAKLVDLVNGKQIKGNFVPFIEDETVDIKIEL